MPISVAAGAVMLAGADGCRAGWVLATRQQARVIPSLASVAGEFERIGVDMPVALVDTWGRRSDYEARRLLARRASTIFPSPPRPLLGHTEYPQANAASKQLFGRGLTRQTFNLFPKVREVVALAEQRPDLLLEVHPECSFRTMTGHDLAPKRTANGFAERRELIVSLFGPIDTSLAGAARDDVLDAYAVLWSVERHARGEHVALGDETGPIIV
jgi:predicted RNase H-like nuclease